MDQKEGLSRVKQLKDRIFKAQLIDITIECFCYAEFVMELTLNLVLAS